MPTYLESKHLEHAPRGYYVSTFQWIPKYAKDRYTLKTGNLTYFSTLSDSRKFAKRWIKRNHPDVSGFEYAIFRFSGGYVFSIAFDYQENTKKDIYGDIIGKCIGRVSIVMHTPYEVPSDIYHPALKASQLVKGYKQSNQGIYQKSKPRHYQRILE